MGRNERVWGPDVDEFRPERWETMKVGREFVPFGGGPRVCIGRLYTFATVMYWVARMAQEFEAIECAYDGPWTENWRVSLASGVGTPVRLYRTIAK
jgi:cytochrome P450